MTRKVFCAALIALGITLDTYFYAFRFIADGLPVFVAIASGIMLELLLSFAVYRVRQSKVYAVIAIAVTVYAVVQTSAGQTFALLSHTASIGVETESNTAAFTIEQCKANIERLTMEASAITTQLKSLQSAEARETYAATITRANYRLVETMRERSRLMDTLTKTTSATVTSARVVDKQKSIYGFYAGMKDWTKDDWLKFLFHFILSVFIAIAAPVGILAWGYKQTQITFSRQQVEMFVAAAWYKIRNNTGMNVLSEIEFNNLLQKRGHLIESGVYFSLMNRCGQLGLVSADGRALEKEHKKVIEKLMGERANLFKSALLRLNKLRAV